MPLANGVPKKLWPWHYHAVKDYCDGMACRDIEDKYKCHIGTIVSIAKDIGITPRPLGFKTYTIAHKWVLQARKDYVRLTNS